MRMGKEGELIGPNTALGGERAKTMDARFARASRNERRRGQFGDGARCTRPLLAVHLPRGPRVSSALCPKWEWLSQTISAADVPEVAAAGTWICNAKGKLPELVRLFPWGLHRNGFGQNLPI
jgi:hypothetical protein